MSRILATLEIVLGVAECSPIDNLTCLHAILFFFLFRVSMVVLFIDLCPWTLEVVEVVFS